MPLYIFVKFRVTGKFLHQIPHLGFQNRFFVGVESVKFSAPSCKSSSIIRKGDCQFGVPEYKMPSFQMKAGNNILIGVPQKVHHTSYPFRVHRLDSS
mmetsp:Transcript_85223/g.227834  ORF Transcript_85223/g.227834 Transcript_85223/m.227834 type:complete len:97 (+) Transcript_85223:331-621(+)